MARKTATGRAIRGTMSIVIAHRFSSVLHADKIVMVNRGPVEAIGRHAELLATSEAYSRLYRLTCTEGEPLGNL